MARVLQLPEARITIDPRPTYLFVIESGRLTSVADIERYVTELEKERDQAKLDRALIDAREEDSSNVPEAVQTAMWAWLRSRPFKVIAFVLEDELTIARVNMTALSSDLKVRAFPDVHPAQRWLLRRRTASGQTMPATSLEDFRRGSGPPKDR